MLEIRGCGIFEVLMAEALLAEYAKESALEGMPPPLADKDTYFKLEDVGALHTFGAFLDGELIGFVTVLSTTLPHYSVRSAVAESIFVTEKHRKTGAGIRLIAAAKQRTRSISAPGLLIVAPIGSVLAEVLERTDCVETNRVFFWRNSDV